MAAKTEIIWGNLAKNIAQIGLYALGFGALLAGIIEATSLVLPNISREVVTISGLAGMAYGLLVYGDIGTKRPIVKK